MRVALVFSLFSVFSGCFGNHASSGSRLPSCESRSEPLTQYRPVLGRSLPSHRLIALRFRRLFAPVPSSITPVPFLSGIPPPTHYLGRAPCWCQALSSCRVASADPLVAQYLPVISPPTTHIPADSVVVYWFRPACVCDSSFVFFGVTSMSFYPTHPS